jgi:RNA polymerase sigma-70 factor, ECF subfamily
MLVMAEPQTYPEAQLVLQSVDGDAAAFGILVRTHMKKAYSLALSLVGNHEDALDLSQDAFVRAWRAMRRFDPGKPFLPWYYAILRNLCLNALRDRIRRPVPFSRVDAAELFSRLEAGDGSAARSAAESTIAVRRALAALGPEDREIILLKDLHGYTYREIADLVSIPAGTVMSRLHTARSRFKALLQAGAT